MLSTVLALVLAATAPKIGVCDPVDGPPLEWSADERAEVRARVRSACKALGAAPSVCTWLDASGLRESSWSPSVRHTSGRGEAGLGVLGLSTHWQRDKWPGRGEEPAFCSPEASVIVALAIVQRAQTVWGAVAQARWWPTGAAAEPSRGCGRPGEAREPRRGVSGFREPPPEATTEGMVCACGNGPDPSEPPTTGLYYDKDGNLAFICLPCWQREACGIVTN